MKSIRLAICFLGISAMPALADVSDPGNLTIGGQAVIGGTMTVQGNAFSVGGSTMVVKEGRVGIGTTTPGAYELHVVAPDDQLKVSDGTYGAIVRANSGGAVFGTNSTSVDAVFMGGGSEWMRIKSGNIGVGTTGPSQALQIDRNTAGAALINTVSGDLSDTASLLFRTDNSDINAGYGRTKGGVIFERKGSYGVGSLHLAVNGETNNGSVSIGYAKLTIDQSGNTGVGTTSPGERLDVSGNIRIRKVTSAPSSAADSIILFSTETATNGAELYVINENGQTTELSPHNFTDFDPDPNCLLPWAHYSMNQFIGKRVSVDMCKLAMLVEKLTGEKLIYVTDIEKRSWTEDQRAKQARRAGEIRDFIATEKASAAARAAEIRRWDETPKKGRVGVRPLSYEMKTPPPAYEMTDPPKWMSDRGVR